MLTKLERIVDEVSVLNSKLILLVGSRRSGKSQLLQQLGAKLQADPVNLGQALGRRLATTPKNKRSFLAADLLRDVTQLSQPKLLAEPPLLLDNLELLFEPSLQVNPLDLIRRLSHSNVVVAVWPGEKRGDRLTYADLNHPEHRDYSQDGTVLFEI